MSEQKMVILDGNEAAASVAYRLSEVVAIYPITPSSPMAEWADQWRSEDKKNIWGALPIVEELQSEGGAAGALHGALQAGAFATTFTASQGLLLMIPNMYKIAGELTPATMHVTARTLATHALSIFGDHSDVMACRSTGWAMLASNSVQEVADMALVAQIATLESRIPFIHFFDGFRTSHEVGKIVPITDETIRALLDDKYIIQFRQNALSPDRPVLRGSAQNPDVFFQAREACTPWHAAVPGIVQSVMNRFAAQTGRAYHLFDYYGASDAERVIILMGSGAEAAEEAVDCSETGREDRPPEGSPLSALRRHRLHQCSSRHRQVHRRTRSLQRARRSRRAALSGCRHRSRRACRDSALCRDAAHHRWPLWTLFEGIHARHGQRHLRRARQDTRRTTSPSASTTTSRTPASTTIRTSPPKIPRPFARSSMASAPTARSAPTRTPSRSSAGDTQLRAGLLRLRLQKVRLDDHLAPALRAQPDPLHLPHHPRQLRRLPQLQLP